MFLLDCSVCSGCTQRRTEEASRTLSKHLVGQKDLPNRTYDVGRKWWALSRACEIPSGRRKVFQRQDPCEANDRLTKPCVIISTPPPPLLRPLPPRPQLFDRWCTEDKNAVLIPGYSVEGTLAKKILSTPDEVTGMDGRVRPMKCAVDYISFSAHVDFVQNKSFIDGVEVWSNVFLFVFCILHFSCVSFVLCILMCMYLDLCAKVNVFWQGRLFFFFFQTTVTLYFSVVQTFFLIF